MNTHTITSPYKVSIFTTPQGHTSIAQSIQAVLKKHHFKTFQNVTVGKIEFELYTIFYRFFPQLFKIPYQLTENRQIKQFIRHYIQSTYQDRVFKQLESQKPAVVVNTHLGFNPILENAQNQHHFFFINIIHDPRTFSTLSVSRQAYNFVFDRQAATICEQMGIPPNKIVVSGWFVRDQFEKNFDKDAAKKKVNLNPNHLTLLVIGGSDGANSILKIAPAFINCLKPLNVVFACGTNRTLFNTIKTFSKILLPKTAKTTIIALEYTSKIYQYVQAADLVIGKAGPNLLFETVATKTPFFAITHIAGQEDGNLEIIKEYKLGYVEERQAQAVKLLKHLINHPEELQQFQKPLDKLAQYNAGSKKILIDFIREKLHQLN